RLAERGKESAVTTARGEVARDQRAGLVDLLLAVQQQKEIAQQRFWPLAVEPSAIGLRDRSSRDVEEAIQVDAHRGIEDAAQQRGRGGVSAWRSGETTQAHMDGVGERECVEGGVPVPELVAGMEAGNAKRGGVADGGGHLRRASTLTQSLEQGVHVMPWVVEQEQLAERGLPPPCAPTGAAGGNGLFEPGEGVFEDGD